MLTVLQKISNIVPSEHLENSKNSEEDYNDIIRLHKPKNRFDDIHKKIQGRRFFSRIKNRIEDQIQSEIKKEPETEIDLSTLHNADMLTTENIVNIKKSCHINVSNCQDSNEQDKIFRTNDMNSRSVYFGEEFATNKVLNRRLNKKQAENELIKCKLCKYVGDKQHKLIKHVNAVHEKLKPYICNECSIPFAAKGNLKSHRETVHFKVKNYACEQCPFKNHRKVMLDNHIKRVHQGVYDFSCTSCKYGTYNKSKLQEHINSVHEKVKDQHCHMCPSKYASSFDLNVHIRTVHEKIWDFQCTDCDYKTNRRAKLNKHISVVHLNKI